MSTKSVRALLILLPAAAFLAAGCVKRTETIRIEPDGTVRMRVVHESESFDEVYLGDPVPVIERGWMVQQIEELKEDGTTVYRLEAETVFGPAMSLPSDYAHPKDPRPGTALQFPTSVTFEERDDGTYVHFYRRYDARPWAFLERPRQMLQKQLQALAGRDFSDMTDPERRALVSALARYEAQKHIAFARAAYRDTLDRFPQDAWLKVQAALLDVARNMNLDYVLTALTLDDPVKRDEMLEDERAAAEKAAREAMRHALRREAGLPLPAINSFFDAWAWQRGYFEITEDLGDDRFVITVVMPGRITGHNGQLTGGQRVRWEFGGEVLRDNELELMATARLR